LGGVGAAQSFLFGNTFCDTTAGWPLIFAASSDVCPPTSQARGSADVSGETALSGVLEQQVKNEKFKACLDHELDGYDHDEDMPTYRVFNCINKVGQA
jgi:hypothetical protein